MRGRKGNLLKVGIAIAGMLFLLAFIGRLPVADAHIMTSGLAATGTVAVQVTPTVDATVTALNKEHLGYENDWWWNYGATVLTSVISTLVLAAAGIFTVVRYFSDRRDAREKQEAEALRLADDRKAERERRDEEQQRWLKDQEAEREKRTEERFQAAVEGLGSTSTATQIGAAIILRTFLRPGYEQFYGQAFDLAVAYLRVHNISAEPEPPDSFDQALIRVFRESFPLARDLPKQSSQSLDALGIRLDNAYLTRSDLRGARMPESYLRKANLHEADLRAANLREANLSGANLHEANLREANLRRANLHEANLGGANLSKADLSQANIEDALALEGTDLRGATGLTEEQLAACKAKGAIIDEEPATTASQSASAPPAPNDETQVLSPRPVKRKHLPSDQKSDT